MPARLKVFQTQIGFHDVIVAASSQKAALAAWDMKQNLFASGQAKETQDTQAVAAALAQPGVVFRRLAGKREPYKPWNTKKGKG